MRKKVSGKSHLSDYQGDNAKVILRFKNRDAAFCLKISRILRRKVKKRSKNKEKCVCIWSVSNLTDNFAAKSIGVDRPIT